MRCSLFLQCTFVFWVLSFSVDSKCRVLTLNQIWRSILVLMLLFRFGAHVLHKVVLCFGLLGFSIRVHNCCIFQVLGSVLLKSWAVMIAKSQSLKMSKTLSIVILFPTHLCSLSLWCSPLLPQCRCPTKRTTAEWAQPSRQAGCVKGKRTQTDKTSNHKP